MGVTWATRGFQGSSFIIFKIEKFCQFPTLLLILHELKKLNFNIKKELTLWILKPVILEMELVTRNSKTSTLNSTKSISFMQCPICNGILEDLIWPKIWKIPPVFCIRSCKQALRKLLSQRNENKQFKQKKHWYLIHAWSDKAFKDTVVNRALWSLQGGFFEITLTVPLNSSFLKVFT